MKQGNKFRSFWVWLDYYLGRGSYRWIRPWLAPYQEDTYLVYSRTLSRLVRPSIRWLDAGCGRKILEPYLHIDEKELVQKASLAVGCDTFLTSLQRHWSLKNIVSCDLDRMPFRDRSFDLVTLNMVAEHLLQPERTFSEIARVLDSDGRLLIQTPSASSYDIKLIRLGWKIIPKRVGFAMVRFLEDREPPDVFPTFYRANTRRQLSSLMREVGMVEEELKLVEGRPFFYFAAPLSILEIVFEWFLRAIGKNELCPATLLGVYRRL
jgi:SAM-dependent methyltransferase